MIDLAITINIILIIFGIKMKIWSESRTTFLIFLIVLISLILLKININIKMIVGFILCVLILLFCRAVFRTYIQKSKFYWFA